MPRWTLKSPNSQRSLRETDFTTALGRLLSDAETRAAFAADSGAVALQLGVRAADYGAFTRLAPAGLEAQAQVLLRKRWRAAAALLPATVALLGSTASALFFEHALTRWAASAAEDAHEFCQWLRERRHELCEREAWRARFAARREGMALNIVSVRPSGRLALQVLVRRHRRIREWLVRFGW